MSPLCGDFDEHHQIEQGLNRIVVSTLRNERIDDDELAAGSDEMDGAPHDGGCGRSIKIAS